MQNNQSFGPQDGNNNRNTAGVFTQPPFVAPPTWDDNVGFISGAVEWARQNLMPGQSISGVRMPYHERFVITHYSRPRQNVGSVEVRLDRLTGQRVVMLEDEISVYPDNYHTRARDRIEQYRPYFEGEGSDQKIVWKRVESFERLTRKFDECPVSFAMWLSEIHEALDVLDEVMPGLDTWVLLSKQQLTNFPKRKVGIIHYQVFQEVQSFVRTTAQAIADETGPSVSPDEVRLMSRAQCEKLVEIIRKVNNVLPLDWRYTETEFEEELSAQLNKHLKLFPLRKLDVAGAYDIIENKV